MEIPKLISNKLVVILNKQIQNELNNARFYRSIGEWCEYNGYFSSGKLFKSYEPEELGHMNKVYSYLQDRNILPETPSAEAQPKEFDSLPSIYHTGLLREIETTEHWKAIAEAAILEKDYTTYQWSQWFLNEQIEECAKFINYLDKMDKTGTDKLGLQFFEEYVEESMEG